MSTRPPEPDAVVDARGALCPQPIIDLARAAAALLAAHGATSGSGARTVRLLADDAAADHDVPAWCRMRGATLTAVTDLPDGGRAYDVVLGTHSG